MIEAPARRSRVSLIASVAGGFALTCTLACSTRGPRDVGNQNARSEFVDGPGGAPPARDASAAGPAGVAPSPSPTGRRPRELAKAESRALATDAARIYFGDASDDTLCSLEKMPAEGADNEPVRVARRAPVAGGLALDAQEGALAWIGTPGDVVLRVPVRGGAPTTVRDRGIFTDVAAAGGDVFFTEARGAGGTLTRVTGTTAAQVASFEGTPRGLVADADHVFVATSSRLLASPRTRGESTELARGTAFGSPQLDDEWLYATAVKDSTRARVVVRVKKVGGALETVATNVRDAPIAVRRGTLYWFDVERPALLSVPVAGGAPERPRPAPRVVSEDSALERVNAIVVDDDGAFLATGHGETARIVAVSLR